MYEIPLSLIIIFFVLLLLSAFFSSAETAYSSANKIRIKSYVEEGRKGATKALMIVENFDKALSTILVGNNLVNIASATIAAQVATAIFGANIGVFVSTFVVTILVLIFGEILPKSFAKENAELLSLRIAGILSLLITIFYPVTWGFLQLKRSVSRLIAKKGEHPSYTEEEIKVMVDISEEEGVIDEKEKELVHRSLDFNDIMVSDALTPRTNVIAVEVNSSTEQVKQLFFEERYSRIPVYEDNIDNIIGILSERDFLTALVQSGEEVNLSTLIRSPHFVVESMKISGLLPELQKNRVHMAIVLDEYGGTAGIITLEDILEELVGEIWDEHDEAVKLVKQIDQSTFIFNADYAVDDFARFAQVELPNTSRHTLGGWIVEEFQRIPEEGEELVYEGLTMKVEEADERRIRRIMVVNENEDKPLLDN